MDESSEWGWRELRRDLSPAVAIPSRFFGEDTLGSTFDRLADTWEAETAFESIVVRKAMHPAYQRIIGLGGRVVPMILRRLQREPHQWFWALAAITGENPAAAEATAEGAAHAWVEWGRVHGLGVD